MTLESRVTGGWRRILYLIVGFVFTAMATAGAFLPVLPTTPFLLLASYCFVRSSPRMHQSLVTSRLFGPFLRDWEAYHGVRLQVKLTAITVLVLGVAMSVWWCRDRPILIGGLLTLAAIGATVVIRLKTIRN